MATRLNGSIDGGYISSTKTLDFVHHIRNNLDLLVVGGNTVRKDRPILDARRVDGKAPNIQIISREVSFDKDGTLIGHYDNGQRIELYKIPLADMTEDTLKRLSDNLWAFSPEVPLNNDPYALIKMDFATNSGLGEIVGGALEMSNVDLTQEFVDMIVAQRAFQANTKVITTDDEILQTVINLKR